MKEPKNTDDAYRNIAIFLSKNDKNGLMPEKAIKKYGKQLRELVGTKYSTILYSLVELYYCCEEVCPGSINDYLENLDF